MPARAAELFSVTANTRAPGLIASRTIPVVPGASCSASTVHSRTLARDPGANATRADGRDQRYDAIQQMTSTVPAGAGSSVTLPFESLDADIAMSQLATPISPPLAMNGSQRAPGTG